MRIAGSWSQEGFHFVAVVILVLPVMPFDCFYTEGMKGACGLEQGRFSPCRWELRLVGTLAEIRMKHSSFALCRARRMQ